MKFPPTVVMMILGAHMLPTANAKITLSTMAPVLCVNPVPHVQLIITLPAGAHQFLTPSANSQGKKNKHSLKSGSHFSAVCNK